MPRPPDHYTHSQFEPIDSDAVDGTVRCVHCKQFTTAAKPLNRKKAHLEQCPAYAAWRAAGNGQDLPPRNTYSKRSSFPVEDQDQFSPDEEEQNYGPQFTPQMGRLGIDCHQFYDEYWDNEASNKCMRARCKYCGLCRAKNSTRQYEHLQQCAQFRDSTEGERFLAEMATQNSNQLESTAPPAQMPPRPDMYRGVAPNPNFGLKHKQPQRQSTGPTKPNPARPAAPWPSLINYLLTKLAPALQEATQQPFLANAGCGTLSVVPVEQYLAQQSAISRALPPFIGRLIGKIRLADVTNPSNNTDWRAFDLLASTVNNAKRELEFLRTTKQTYGLQNDTDTLRHATKSILDLLESASSPSASLLEGMIVLWGIEYLHLQSWVYAESYHTTTAPQSTSYDLPTFYQSSTQSFASSSRHTNGMNGNESALHTIAMYKALIPNWTSTGFSKFVDACQASVDELANAQTTGNGAKELANAEQVFGQLCWLWRMMWPEVTGMGEQDETAEENANGVQKNGSQDAPLEIEDGDDGADGLDDAPAADSPYGGTGLGLIAAANRGA